MHIAASDPTLGAVRTLRTPVKRQSAALLASLLCTFLVACGGGGGGAPGVSHPIEVRSGYDPVTNSGGLSYTDGNFSTGGSGGGGGTGGSAGAGGGLGAFRNALVTVVRADGTAVGSALTDRFGMVTIENGGDKQPLLITVQGADNARYWDEALQQELPFPATQILHVMVAATGAGETLSKNVGITPLTEAAYQYAVANLGGVNAWKTAANVAIANQAVAGEFNRFLPSTLQIDDITRLPALARDDQAQVFDATSKNVNYGLVSAGLVRAASMHNPGAAPGIELLRQLTLDLSDGRLNGVGPRNEPVAPSGQQAYDPSSLSADLLVGVAQMADINGKAQPPVITYTLGGTVSGLTSAGLKLASGGATQAVPANAASFSLGAVLVAGSAYDVQVQTQPIGQVCTVARGTGTTGTANVTDVGVTCAALPLPPVSIGGTVSGLSGSGLVLQANGGNNLAVGANGNFTFTTLISSGSVYSVTVLTQPTNPAQLCDVSNGSGTAAANVTNVAVTCTTAPPVTFSIGGAVTGLAGTGLVLQNNAGDNLSVVANGSATFATRVPSGNRYEVTVLAQPANPTQTCSVSNGSGTATANVTNVAVTCTTVAFGVGGTVSGLAGTGLTLQNNGGDNLAVVASGRVTFSTPVASGGAYGVTVFSQPTGPAQICTVTNGAGMVGAANVTNVAVTCTTTSPTLFSISVTVSGLEGTGLELQDNGRDNLRIGANGNATFATPLARGGTYNVTVFTQPTKPSQTCVVSNGTGTVTTNVGNIGVTCTTRVFNVGGTVSGLAGTGLVLLNNGGNNLAVGANGNVTFTTPVASGSAYDVTVLSQPTNPFQTCAVTNGAGTVLATSVVNIAVSCTNQSVRYAYVANSSDNSVATYVVDAVSGRLKFIDKVAAGSAPSTVSVDPSGRFAYVANRSDGTVSQYTIGTNGSLTPMTPATVSAGPAPNSVSVDPSGRFVYVVNYVFNGTVSQYTIGADGGLAPIPGAPTVAAGEYPISVTVHPSAKFAYVVNNGTNVSNGDIAQYAIGANGGFTPNGPAVPAGTNPSILSVDPSGRFAYVANWNSSDVSQYTIGADGRLAAMSPVTVATGSTPNSVAVDPSGKFAYASIWVTGNVSQFTIGQNGGLIPVPGAATVAAETGPSSVAVDPSGKFVYVTNFVSNSISQYTIGPDGGLTPNAPVTVAALGGPLSVAFSHGASASVAVAKYAYVANTGSNHVSNVSQYTVGAGGNLTPMDPATVAAGLTANSISVDPSRKFAYVANLDSNDVSQYTIGTNGSLTPMPTATVAAGTAPQSVSVDPSGKFAYVANLGSGSNNVSQYTIGTNGSLTPMTPATVAAGTGPHSVSVDPSGKFAYVANLFSYDISQYTIGTNGSLTPMTPASVAAGTVPNAVSVDPSGKFAYVANNISGNVSQYRIGANGSLTPLTSATVAAGAGPLSVISIGTWQ